MHLRRNGPLETASVVEVIANFRHSGGRLWPLFTDIELLGFSPSPSLSTKYSIPLRNALYSLATMYAGKNDESEFYFAQSETELTRRTLQNEPPPTAGDCFLTYSLLVYSPLLTRLTIRQ